jgi:glycosyltransferase involved in cell wall biosynthesis
MARPLRIALILEAADRSGGGFQQGLTTIMAARRLSKHETIVYTTVGANVSLIRQRGIACEPLGYGGWASRVDSLSLRSSTARRRLLSRVPMPSGPRTASRLDLRLRAERIDLALFLAPSELPRRLICQPYFATVWDLAHRDHPEFPEVSEQFADRESIFQQTLPRALRVIVSSTALGRQVSALYGVDPERLLVLPLLPGVDVRARPAPDDVERVRVRYGLQDDYVFYPAQLRPHKNHLYILEALRTLEDRDGIRLHAAFSGADFGSLAYLRAQAQELGFGDRIHFLGFVPSGDLAALYAGALALAMPTYFGPTNIPPLEALSVGCPVIYSDLPEFREDLGDAALYCDLKDPCSMAGQLLSLIKQPDRIEQLRSAAPTVLTRVEPSLYADRLAEAFDEFSYTRRRWM